MQARAPSAGKCTKRWKVHEPRTARISRRALLPPRATACARCSSRLSDGTGSCINQRQTRTAGSRAAAVGFARQTLQIASAGDAGSRAERWKVHEALESARAEDALERRQWQLHQLAPDSHRWLACSCRRRRLSASAAALRPGTTACRRPRGVLCCTTDPPTRSPALACCARRARRQAVAIAPTPVQWRLRPSATSAFPYCACAPSRRPC